MLGWHGAGLDVLWHGTLCVTKCVSQSMLKREGNFTSGVNNLLNLCLESVMQACGRRKQLQWKWITASDNIGVCYNNATFYLCGPTNSFRPTRHAWEMDWE